MVPKAGFDLGCFSNRNTYAAFIGFASDNQRLGPWRGVRSSDIE